MARANFKFGVSQEDIEKQEAKELREQEAYIQQKTQERNRKLEKLNKKNKRNRIILILLFILFFIGMLVFGTYNTFFKQIPSEEDIEQLITIKTQTFNTYGVEGFLHNSVAPFFQDRASMVSEEEEDVNIEYFELDPNSVRVTRIIQVPNTADTAIVYFNANVTVKQADGYKEENGKRVPYVGETTYNEYQFRVVIYYDFKNRSYQYASDLEMQPQILKDDYSFDKIQESQYLSFKENEIEEVKDEAKVENIKIKVDRILSDLYEGKNTGSDSDTNRFNTNDTYKGIVEFKIYQQDNSLGYNAICSYKVESMDHLSFINTVYLKISSNGENSWKIEKFL